MARLLLSILLLRLTNFYSTTWWTPTRKSSSDGNDCVRAAEYPLRYRPRLSSACNAPNLTERWRNWTKKPPLLLLLYYVFNTIPLLLLIPPGTALCNPSFFGSKRFLFNLFNKIHEIIFGTFKKEFYSRVYCNKKIEYESTMKIKQSFRCSQLSSNIPD